MPELLGRLPNRIALKSLNRYDLKKVLTNIEYNLLYQQQKLLSTEDINIEFTDSGIDYQCQTAEEMNQNTENIGVRRLHGLIELIMEEISFNGPDNNDKSFVIDQEYIAHRLVKAKKLSDYSKYLL